MSAPIQAQNPTGTLTATRPINSQTRVLPRLRSNLSLFPTQMTSKGTSRFPMNDGADTPSLTGRSPSAQRVALIGWAPITPPHDKPSIKLETHAPVDNSTSNPQHRSTLQSKLPSIQPPQATVPLVNFSTFFSQVGRPPSRRRFEVVDRPPTGPFSRGRNPCSTLRTSRLCEVERGPGRHPRVNDTECAPGATLG